MNNNKKEASKKPSKQKPRKKSVRQAKSSRTIEVNQEKKKRGGIRNIKYLGGKLFAKMVRGGTSELRTNAEEVNRLNVFPVPDGDTGTNMSMTIANSARELEKLSGATAGKVASVNASALLRGARGNSGVILSQLFRGFSKSIETKDEINA